MAYTTIVLSVSGLAIHAHEIYPEKPIQAIEEMADDDVPTPDEIRHRLCRRWTDNDARLAARLAELHDVSELRAK